jgi:multidrug efflux pump subunit AcrB
VYGVTADQIRNQLFNAYGARQVGTIYMPSNDYQIILEVQPKFRVDPSDLSKLYVKTANNRRFRSMPSRRWCRPLAPCRSIIRASNPR